MLKEGCYIEWKGCFCPDFDETAIANASRWMFLALYFDTYHDIDKQIKSLQDNFSKITLSDEITTIEANLLWDRKNVIYMNHNKFWWIGKLEFTYKISTKFSSNDWEFYSNQLDIGAYFDLILSHIYFSRLIGWGINTVEISKIKFSYSYQEYFIEKDYIAEWELDEWKKYIGDKYQWKWKLSYKFYWFEQQCCELRIYPRIVSNRYEVVSQNGIFWWQQNDNQQAIMFLLNIFITTKFDTYSIYVIFAAILENLCNTPYDSKKEKCEQCWKSQEKSKQDHVRDTIKWYIQGTHNDKKFIWHAITGLYDERNKYAHGNKPIIHPVYEKDSSEPWLDPSYVSASYNHMLDVDFTLDLIRLCFIKRIIPDIHIEIEDWYIKNQTHLYYEETNLVPYMQSDTTIFYELNFD